MFERVIVTIAPTGRVKVEADGFQGSGCSQPVGQLADALGVTIDDQKKPEHYGGQGQADQERQA